MWVMLYDEHQLNCVFLSRFPAHYDCSIRSQWEAQIISFNDRPPARSYADAGRRVPGHRDAAINSAGNGRGGHNGIPERGREDCAQRSPGVTSQLRQHPGIHRGAGGFVIKKFLTCKGIKLGWRGGFPTRRVTEAAGRPPSWYENTR